VKQISGIVTQSCVDENILQIISIGLDTGAYKQEHLQANYEGGEEIVQDNREM